ncbi:MAG: hypothetical protein WA432_00160 [Candidatus Babeliaceae bacterium]
MNTLFKNGLIYIVLLTNSTLIGMSFNAETIKSIPDQECAICLEKFESPYLVSSFHNHPDYIHEGCILTSYASMPSLQNTTF